jgi:hypothetical protein
MISEEILQNWSNGPSDTEQEKCENTEKLIREALNYDAQLSKMNILVFTQGSYKANTNIKHDSDVDICILSRDSIFADYPLNFTDADAGLVDGSLKYSEFKNLVEAALVKKFGRAQVVRGNKAFDIHENTSRVAADVVPAFEHRRYTGEHDNYGSPKFLSGVEFKPDNGGRIINWPEHTYVNGINKNTATSRRYKRLIRILKRLRNKMQDDKISASNNIASFLIESLVWNTPNEGFNHSTYLEDLRYILAHTFNNTRQDEHCKEWGEVNELKYLFRSAQPWSRSQANNFLYAAWDYAGLK